MTVIARRLLIAAAAGGTFDTIAGFYNSKTPGGPQQLYYASSNDGGRTFTVGNGGSPVIQKASSPGSWYDEHIAQSCVLLEGSTYVLWASGYDGTKWQIGRWTASSLSDDPLDWTADPSNPLITIGSPGDADESGANFPQVEYDAGSGIERIWYTGWSTKTTICYAERASSGTITKYGRVINVGAAGAFDDEGLETGPVITIGGEKRVYYDGQSGTTEPYYSVGYVSYTDPQNVATYTKHGQLADLRGVVTLDDGPYESVHLHSLLPLDTGGYIALGTAFHPYPSPDGREVSFGVFTNNGVNFETIFGPVIPMDSAWPDAESRENPAMVVV